MTASSRTPAPREPGGKSNDPANAQETGTTTPDTSKFPSHADMFGTTTNPCPAWCTMPDGHGYDATGYPPDGTPNAWEFRIHSCTIAAAGTGGVDVIQGEQLYSDGRVELQAPEINPPENGRENLTGPQARAVAVALVKAADLWDTIYASSVTA